MADQPTGARVYDYSQFRPASISQEAFDDYIAKMRQAAAEGGLDLLPQLRDVYLSGGGSADAWAEITKRVVAEANPLVTDPEAGASVAGVSTPAGVTAEADAEYAARTAGKPGTGAAATEEVATYLGMPAGWTPAAGENAPNYLTDSEVAEFSALTPSRRAEIKQEMFDAGLYGEDADPAKLLLGTSQWTEADMDAFRTLLGEANINRTTWDRALAFRQEAADVYGPDSLTPEQEAALVDEGVSFQQSLRQFADANGLTMSDEWIRTSYEQSLDGKTSLEQVQQKLREKYVATAFPAWKDDILAGENVATLAAPYIGSLETMLDMPEGSVGLDDPLIRKALQGVDDKGKPTYVPLYQFEYSVRQDPRWEQSTQGMNERADAMNYAYEQITRSI